MAEKKSYQKNLGFKLSTLAQLYAIAEKEIRSEQNMIEVLIHERFSSVYGKDAIAIPDGYPIKKVEVSRATVSDQ